MFSDLEIGYFAGDANISECRIDNRFDLLVQFRDAHRICGAGGKIIDESHAFRVNGLIFVKILLESEEMMTNDHFDNGRRMQAFPNATIIPFYAKTVRHKLT